MPHLPVGWSIGKGTGECQALFTRLHLLGKPTEVGNIVTSYPVLEAILVEQIPSHTDILVSGVSIAVYRYAQEVDHSAIDAIQLLCYLIDSFHSPCAIVNLPGRVL